VYRFRAPTRTGVPNQAAGSQADAEQKYGCFASWPNFVEAVRMMAHYESIQVFPRGTRLIDWSTYAAISGESLRLFFKSGQGILDGMNYESLDELGYAAGMIQLWVSERETMAAS